jgi:hypothetical protein
MNKANAKKLYDSLVDVLEEHDEAHIDDMVVAVSNFIRYIDATYCEQIPDLDITASIITTIGFQNDRSNPSQPPGTLRDTLDELKNKNPKQGG